ncbi:polyisoprenoid-binding protein [Chryseobacterium lactis]|uniref:Polyisoprenoid-binding protein n=1 Tax=Chryseobacterium lactis TaxID=1241981 RepID=A0A3G6RV15_CHRLC|nr:YceI family protein [Chryseobacterium lactis]AZA80722.1 polyisoprenoid-binding protein [Chryseobacterium lactis]AZB05724.1 polyisoprenoid-binding protein [Chryseobacterium lactis]PNW13556.1 polyisoprenoid-binding protein [Chryseobacterium lactis]
MKKVFLSFVFVLFSMMSFAQNNWEIDPMHSSVNFNIKHMGISFVQGRFDKFNGKVVTKGANLDNATFNIAILAESINTNVEMRDQHLRSDEFFAVGRYPEILFESTSVTKDKEGSYTFKGKLTIKGNTNDVSIPVTFGGITKNKSGKEVMGLQAKFNINRLDYKIDYDPSGAGIAKDAELSVYLELVKK